MGHKAVSCRGHCGRGSLRYFSWSLNITYIPPFWGFWGLLWFACFLALLRSLPLFTVRFVCSLMSRCLFLPFRRAVCSILTGFRRQKANTHPRRALLSGVELATTLSASSQLGLATKYEEIKRDAERDRALVAFPFVASIPHTVFCCLCFP